jgi:hypothetical protein
MTEVVTREDIPLIEIPCPDCERLIKVRKDDKIVSCGRPECSWWGRATSGDW